jgi:L-ascorbate metabolism protein UlaG (beta-lactamase superfamily)
MTCNTSVEVIATGSKGNAVVLGGVILIDCGVPFKKLEPYAQQVQLVLCTHRHGDHFNPTTIRRLHQERPALRFGCCYWLVEYLIAAGVAPANIDVYDIGPMYDYGAMQVESFPLVHDVQNCGYKIHMNGERILYATDTGTMDHVEAMGFDWYLIEANHMEHEITERIQRKTEAGEFVYEYRAAENHLSRESADLWLASNAGRNSKIIYLHGHEERNEK